MRAGTLPTVTLGILCVGTAALMGCGGLPKEYEYEEEIYLALDGSATVNVNASVAALVALRGAPLDPDPYARVDRGDVRALFEGPGAEVTRVSLSRRDRRRFVHVGIDVDDVRKLPLIAPFSWSSYHFVRRGEVFEYRQLVGAPAGNPVGDAGWNGGELVAFRMHIPSEIPFHNSPNQLQRGNILQWVQPLAERLHGTPVELVVHMEPDSILHTTLILFGSTIVAAAATFGVGIWWVVRRGAESQVA